MKRAASPVECLIEREAKRLKHGADETVAYDGAVLTRWLQMVARQSALYNVNNRHQCFAGTPPPTRPVNVVRPFDAIPDFYGCLLCGRYHFCRRERETCEIYYSEASQVEVCLYSGRVLRCQNDLQADEYEERMRAAIDSEECDAYRRGGALYEPRGVAITEDKRRKKKKTKSKALQISEIIKQHTVQTTTTTTEPIEVDDNGEEEEEEEGSRDDDEESESETMQGMGEEDDKWQGFNKNYHNNLQHNNAMFAFLWPSLRGDSEPTPSTVDLCRRDIVEEHATRHRSDLEEVSTGGGGGGGDWRVVDTVSETIRNKIADETKLIVSQLLLLCRPRAVSGDILDELTGTLVCYYTDLIVRIVGLVTRSANWVKLLATKEAKSLKQQHSVVQLTKVAVTTIDCSSSSSSSSSRSIAVSEQHVQRIVEALMLSLFLRPVAFNDAMGNRVDIWYRDPWLYHVVRVHLASKIAQRRKSIEKTNQFILDCLASYSWCPLWLRATLFPCEPPARI